MTSAWMRETAFFNRIRKYIPPGSIFILLIFALSLPIFADAYVVEVAILLLFYAALASSWDILGGWAGQFSFGHAAFFGIGAYVSTLLLQNAGLTPWIGILLSAAAAAALGIVVAIPTFRVGLKGHYFALAMFAMATMLMVAFMNITRIGTNPGLVIGGAEGLQIAYGGSDPANMIYDDRRAYYYILLGLTTFILGCVFWLSKSRFGYYLQSIKNDEDAAEALGVNVFRCKVIAMAISAAFTGMIGTVYAQLYLYVEPASVFSPAYSINGLLCAVIGGAGTVMGPLLGALLITPLAEVSKLIFRGLPGFDLMLFGLILIVAVRYLPNGLGGLLSDIVNRRSGPSR